ncbi:NAD(P)/FAD-dependent oxidoreductase [Rhodopseudomonas sp. P2A-2r]|uniref:flavin-containing monooxygenase n=1 Tax=Rhodopseudomonas sp. P2A-2r TaxID=2991972 RepID=UPI002234B273|nr:NAD(P)/FAD-dependent oxidoreductase [Rhodopseudomonas sp. P2A-2r]UZE51068.1 NAD(P)/FAD-dependent oxidoreductase [Rhodopseudomonas sp. P2A-2r]
MPGDAEVRAATELPDHPNYDVIIIGAGVSGLYQLYRLRELGLNVRVFEAGSDVGGTWHWNRYPGARFDSESWTYGYSRFPGVLDEWNWSEHFASQPEIERYLQFVADRFDLRPNIQFGCRVTHAHFSEALRGWRIELADGTVHNSRFLVTAIGVLSAPTLPRIDGIESFKGQACHTAQWPTEEVSFEGKRVAVIGTGSTGVQTIQEAAKTARHLTVFQRTPNWCAPLHNAKISAPEMAEIRSRYDEIFARCQATPGCFIHGPDPRSALEVTLEEREAFLRSATRSQVLESGTATSATSSQIGRRTR